jgi:hypothetical protein
MVWALWTHAARVRQRGIIKPRGANAERYFENIYPGNPLPANLQIENSVEFLVNDVTTEGYFIYKSIFNF